MLLVRSLLCSLLLALLAPSSLAQPTGGPGSVVPRQKSPADPAPPTQRDTAAPDATRPPRDPSGWLGAGLGIGGYGLAGQLEAAVQVGPNVFMGRHVLTTDIFADLSGTGALYGRTADALALLAGVGIVRGHQQHPLSEPGTGPEVSPTPGLALHGQWRIGHWGPTGLALSGFANLNGSQSFAGLTLTAQFGRF